MVTLNMVRINKMGRSILVRLSFGLAVVFGSCSVRNCSGQAGQNTKALPAQSGLPNNSLQIQTGLPTLGLPPRLLLRTGLIQLQPPAPVITPPIFQLLSRLPPLTIPPALVLQRIPPPT